MNIQLVREGLAEDTVNSQQVWPLKVTASVINNAMPSSKIFVYHASMGDDQYEGDLFECVASLPQYFSLPENAGTYSADGTVTPYYRSDVLYFACASADEADQLWLDIQDDVRFLVNNYNAFSDLEVQETVDI
jgi:hypothetical protein